MAVQGSTNAAEEASESPSSGKQPVSGVNIIVPERNTDKCLPCQVVDS